MSGPGSEPTLAARTRAYWYPRVRGGLLVLAGTLAYTALTATFGETPGFGSALIGMCGSLLSMSFVWWLEARRSAREDAAAARSQRGAGTT
jgi:hypothetical protein